VRPEVQAYFRAAHQDALSYYRRLAGISLDPLSPPAPRDPATVYPHQLHATVLTGYFGEVFAGIVVEHFSPHAEDGWEVPAFLFRKHNVAFEQLEAYFQGGKRQPKPIPGRTGDDCLAFCRGPDGEIVKSLYCEAKCTTRHDSSMIAEAHTKVNSSAMVSILQLIEVLSRRGSREAARWVEALREYRLKVTAKSPERLDLVCYVCGQPPKRDRSWISAAAPHDNYRTRRALEAVEVHLQGVEQKVEDVYARGAWK
jgi:hypothetical protein